ncbi:hypothetical protein SAMN04487950_1168 [Halogranum rubrum]|uniref:Polymerase/histidinol phosphatase N-terminal domain-containing protein n=2 Tax=Halogranum rubrum TaxID=553466 RepID=A0A1I4CGF3_9EURY|nr:MULTISPECIES: PHP-associated domain-containing protein [Halogranum]EJN59344.1 PHP domain protein [Halogranum salarium B-1]SFK80294.1 hypothetical protein SAMN04487950_1168 [Halogranum rubrum]
MYAVDLHSHSRFFHGWPGRATRYDAFGLKLNTIAARVRGLDALAVTNHDYTYSAETRFPTIPGIEVSSSDGHILVVGPNPPSRTEVNQLSAAETVDLAHDRQCAAILAHPYRNSNARNADADFDAIEINGKNPEHIAQTKELAKRLDLPLVGGSDAHYLVEVGRAYTRIDADELTPAAIATAIRDGRVTAVTKFGPLDRAIDRAYTRLHTEKQWMESDGPELAER